MLAVVLFDGLFEIMRFDTINQDQLFAVQNYEASNHEDDIFSLDFDL